ncbi:MAG: ATP synthase F0 subunit B [Lachnospiraceae bacterium]|nr:ATP synthase F0 subunit B [Lachnospiraceae bacterium]
MSGNIIAIDPVSIVLTVVNLLVLFLIMKFFLFKPVNAVLEKRQEEISKDKKAAEEAVKNAEEKVKSFESQLKDIDKLKSDAITESTKKADAEYDRIVGDANKRAAEIISEAEAKADLDVKRKQADAEKRIADIVASATKKIAASQNSAELDSGLYDEFISKAGEEVDS